MTMNKNANPLVPVKLRDKNGHMVTRWVRMLESGEHALNLPAPSFTVPQRMVDDTFDILFPDFNEDTEMLMDVFGQDVEYTDVFIRHALEYLPLSTLTAFTAAFTDDASPGQNYLALCAYDYLFAMYSVGRGDDSLTEFDQSVTTLNNATVFHQAMSDLSRASGHRLNADDVNYVLNWALHCYETPDENVALNLSYPDSQTDYSKLSQRKQREAVGYVITFRAMQHAGVEDGRPRPETAAFVADNLDRQREIASVMISRKIQDVGLLKEMLDSEAPVLTDGVL